MPDFDALSREELITLCRQLWDAAQAAAQVPALLERIAALEEELARLRKDPPPGVARAVPIYVKPNVTPKGADPTEKKPRKKRSHPHVRRKEQATCTVEHTLDRCPDCGRRLSEGWMHRTRQVIEIPLTPYEVIEHRIFGHHCGVCKKNHVARPDLSAQVLGRHRMGIRLMSLVVMLKKSCRLTVTAIQKLLRSLYGLRLGRGEIIEILRAVAQKGHASYAALRDGVRGSPFVHADETSWRKNGRNEWMWVFCTPDTRFFIEDPSRGHQVPERVLGERYPGIVASDFLSAYNYHLGVHQRCWVHYLRDLKELERDYPKDVGVRRFVRAVKRVYERARSYQSENRKRRVRARERFQEALMTVAKPWLGTDAPQRVLAERILHFANELFTFVEHPDVDSHNNAAERAIRPAVIYRKVTGGSRSEQGAMTTSVLLSLVGTWTLRGQDVLDTCMQMLAGTANCTTLSHAV